MTDVLALFRVIFRSVRQHNRYIEERCGIGAMQLRALAVVKARPRIGVTALAEALFVHQPTASKLVDALVGLGLVERRRRPDDRRVMELLVTRGGLAMLKKAPSPALGVLPDGLGALDPEALRQLGSDLGRLLAAMRVRDDAARFEPLSDS